MREVTRWFEDFRVGDILPLGGKIVTAAEIAAYAVQFDPREPYLSGTEAAPWHIGGLFMRQFFDGLLAGSSGRGSPGIEDLAWPTPLKAGDRISVSAEVLEVRTSKSRPDTGLVRLRFRIVNQPGACIMTGTSWTMFGRREVSHAVA
jgi:acyl dehydratase